MGTPKPTSTKKKRSVIAFHQDPPGDDASLSPIQKEVDLKDYEVLIETYNFLYRNRRKQMNQGNSNHNQNSNHNHRDVDHKRGSAAAAAAATATSTTSSTAIVSDKHKWAILILTEVDAITKRVVNIDPGFFPPTTRVLPACLVGPRLHHLTSLCLDHCHQLTGLPSGFCLPNLKELFVNVTSFQEPFPERLGDLKHLRTLVIRGKCSGFDNWSKCGDDDESGTTLFPPSLAKLKTLRHLEIHARNLLQLPAKVFESWGSTLESLVTIQECSFPNSTAHQHGTAQQGENSDGFVAVPRNQSYSYDDSSTDSGFPESSDDDSIEDCGFSILRHRTLFREALERQLEVRAFRSIARFRKLRSLRLLLDDSKHRISRRKTRPNNSNSSYSVPLALLAGPLSMSLKDLAIGFAPETPPGNRTPIEVSWIDILQEFPRLETLRLTDCVCSFSNKTETVTLSEQPQKVLRMPRLRELVLDRCPCFAMDEKPMARSPIEESSTLFQDANEDDDIEIVDSVNGPETVVFRPRLGGVVDDGNCNGEKNTNGNDNGEDAVYFQPLKAEPVSRIVRLGGVLAETIQTPRIEHGEHSPTNGGGGRTMLSNFCTRFLRRCPALEVVRIHDCQLTGWCEDLTVCLPKNCLQELTLDVPGGIGKHHLLAIVKAYPSLVKLEGTCLDSLSHSERNVMHRSMAQRGWQRLRQTNSNHKKLLGGVPSLPRPWSILWDKTTKENSDNETMDRPSGKKDGVRLPWPVAALEKTLQQSVVALEQKLFPDSSNNTKKRQTVLASAVGKSLRWTQTHRST